MKLYEFLHIHAIEAQHERKNCMSGRSAPQPTDVDFCDRRLLRPVDDRPELSAQSGAVAAPGAEMSRVPSTNLSEKVGSLTPPTPRVLGKFLVWSTFEHHVFVSRPPKCARQVGEAKCQEPPEGEMTSRGVPSFNSRSFSQMAASTCLIKGLQKATRSACKGKNCTSLCKFDRTAGYSNLTRRLA